MPRSQKSAASPSLVHRVFALYLCSLPMFAQNSTSPSASQKRPMAYVTFVDNGMTLTGGLGEQSQSFRGKLFVEDRMLAHMQPAHFVTFAFEPVPVEFTAQTWMASGPRGGSHIILNLVAGKHYFIELRTRQAWPVTKMFGIKEISCQQAQTEHEHDRPLDSLHIKAGGDPAVVSEVSFPTCS